MSGDTVAAPMQGTVIKILVADGDTVEEGDAVVVLEAMKMENAVKAHKSGTVTALSVTTGEGVTRGQALLDIV